MIDLVQMKAELQELERKARRLRKEIKAMLHCPESKYLSEEFLQYMAADEVIRC